MAYQFGVGEYELSNGLKAKVWEKRNDELLGYWLNQQGKALLDRWRLDGKNGSPAYDLVVPKQKRTYWINIYPDDIANEAHRSPASAKGGRGFNSHAIACKEVTIEFTPGEGLD